MFTLISHNRLFFLLFAIALYLAFLGALGLSLSSSTVHNVFGESGFFENMSVLFWIAAVLLPVFYLKKSIYKASAFLITFLLFAARELGLHKAFTSDSFLKINYYEQGFGLEQYIAGAFAVFSIFIVLFVMISIIRYVFCNKGWKCFSGQCLFIACGLLIGTKILDRAPAILRRDLDINLGGNISDVSRALEEGLEMIVPVLFILALSVKPNIFTDTADKTSLKK